MALVALAAALVAVTLLGINRNAGRTTDYVQDYNSGKALADGRSVYAPMSEADAGVTENPRVRSNDHPPPYIVALAPLAALPYPAAHMALAVLGLVPMIGAGLLLGTAHGWGAVGGWLVVLAVLLHPGTGVGVVYGNTSTLLLALIVLAWRAMTLGKETWAGVCIGLATGLKLFPGLLVFALLATRQWRGAAVAGATVVACWIGAAAVVGVDDVRTFITERAPENARSSAPSALNLSVVGVAHRTFAEPDPYTNALERAAVRPDLVPAVVWGLRLSVALVVAAGFYRTGRATTADRAVALLLPAMLLLSPLTWLHAVPLVAVTVMYLAVRSTTRPRRAALALCGLALMTSDLWLGSLLIDHYGHVPWWGNFVLLTPTWGLFGTLVLTAAWAEHREPSFAEPKLGGYLPPATSSRLSSPRSGRTPRGRSCR